MNSDAHQLYLKQMKAGELVEDKNKELPSGFDLGYEVEKILGGTEQDGEELYYVKWV